MLCLNFNIIFNFYIFWHNNFILGVYNLIFLPNSFERYIAALRILNHLLVLKSGINKKRLTALKKIYKAEAFYFKNSTSPFSVSDFVLPILSAAQTLLNEKNKNFDFSVNTNGIYLFNKQLFTVLLLELCSTSKYIRISDNHLGVNICFNGKINNSLYIIKNLKGYYFYEKFSNKGVIVLPFEKTLVTPSMCESEWYYIFDKFSPVNLYF